MLNLIEAFLQKTCASHLIRVIFPCQFFLAACAMNTEAQWQPVPGTAMLKVNCLALKDSLAFAGTDNGVYYSADTGKSFSIRSSGITSDTVLALLLTDSMTFIGTKGGGVFRSFNHGLSWTAASAGITDSVIRCFSEMGERIFAGAQNGEIYSSDDWGSGWTLLNSGITQ